MSTNKHDTSWFFHCYYWLLAKVFLFVITMLNWTWSLQAVKKGDTIFIGQYLFTGSETTSVWLEVKWWLSVLLSCGLKYLHFPISSICSDLTTGCLMLPVFQISLFILPLSYPTGHRGQWWRCGLHHKELCCVGRISIHSPCLSNSHRFAYTYWWG